MSRCKCCSNKIKKLSSFQKMDFDGSIFNHESEVYFCENCGYLETRSPYLDSDNADHYANHVLYNSMSGIGVGGDTTEDRFRYNQYLKLLDLEQATLVDIGCSRGGFLKHIEREIKPLSTKLFGVDIDIRSMTVGETDSIQFMEGNVHSLPLADSSVDILTYFHVFEHIRDLDGLINEARRVLKENGSLVIEVPNAVKYNDANTYVGVGFWLYMQEHLSHFCTSSLTALLARNGFEVENSFECDMPIKNKSRYPSLIIKAKLGRQESIKTTTRNSADDLEMFVDQELAKSESLAKNCLELNGPITFWGISLEFFNVYSNMKKIGKNCPPVRLIDNNQSKQKCAFQDIIVEKPNKVPTNGTLVISSYITFETIKAEALKLGWKDSQIFYLHSLNN